METHEVYQAVRELSPRARRYLRAALKAARTYGPDGEDDSVYEDAPKMAAIVAWLYEQPGGTIDSLIEASKS